MTPTTVTSNRQIRLAERPRGLPGPGTWRLSQETVGEPGPGEVRVAVEYLSLDPAMRGWLRDVRSYVEPVAVGDVMRAHGVGRVTASSHPEFAVGEHVSGMLGAQEHTVVDAAGLRRVDLDVAAAPTWLGLLGYPGMTAYFGLFDVARLKPDDVVLVSGAAGAVGSVVGQLATLHGCRVIGIAGGPEKCAWLRDELHISDTIDYKGEDVDQRLRHLAPRGIDVYFDNVGGPMLDSALARLALGARVVICGAISQYNNVDEYYAPKNYMSLLVNRASMTGLMVFAYQERFSAAIGELGPLLADGRLVAREQVVEGGVPGFPDALMMLFSGENTGKLVLKVAQP